MYNSPSFLISRHLWESAGLDITWGRLVGQAKPRPGESATLVGVRTTNRDNLQWGSGSSMSLNLGQTGDSHIQLRVF